MRISGSEKRPPTCRKPDTGRRAARAAARSRYQIPEKERANTMTMKEKLQTHKAIEEENRAKLLAFLEQRKTA